MSDCCSSNQCEINVAAPSQCPECGRKGKKVGHTTLEHLLREPPSGEAATASYNFCATPDCDVVYFSAPSLPVFHKRDLKVRVGIKETEDPIPVCYCYNHTRASIWDEIARTGSTRVLDEIKSEVKAGRCQCEIKNPSGNCCLGDVTRVVQEGLRQAVPAQS